jgi:XTP/dITP diphosphohydrolase
MEQNSSTSFLRLVKIMDELREQCPWDKKQTIQTLRSMTIEETYELTDAIIDEDWNGIKEELGDIMLHLLFYSLIAKEQNKFTLDEVLTAIAEKLIRRHPHIYGNVKVNNEEDVTKNWQNIKIKEGKESVLSGVPKSLPSVVKATRIQEKAKQVGFEWENKEDVFKKIEEEINELREAVATKEQDKIEEEFGDTMFSLINYARFLQVDAETALERTNKKFIKRFKQMEAMAWEQNKQLNEMSLSEMDAIWNEIKSKIH